jgi:hypothetical protein
MQSHGRQVRHLAEIPRWCDDVTDSASPARFARRSVLKAAVLASHHEVFESSLIYTVIGKILDVSPHVLVLETDGGEQRFPVAASATAWRGGPVAPAALRQGDHAIVRRNRPGSPVIERIWAEVGRVTGTIIERDGPATLLVDEGAAKGRRIVIIGAGASGRIQVRFPRLEPGYLIDVIGLRHDGFLQALIPATAQPPYHAGHPPVPPMVSGHVPDPLSGSVVWHEPGEEPCGLLGLAYPALDPETGCERAGAALNRPGPAAAALNRPGPPGAAHTSATCRGDLHAVDPHATGPGCIRLPYLSVGSVIRLRNDCAERSRLLPVTSCGATARLFCDRCVSCGTSQKGRIADLTMAAFVELGGDLEAGCFNATMTIGG